jgi:hypothetical protein
MPERSLIKGPVGRKQHAYGPDSRGYRPQDTVPGSTLKPVELKSRLYELELAGVTPITLEQIKAARFQAIGTTFDSGTRATRRALFTLREARRQAVYDRTEPSEKMLRSLFDLCLLDYDED